jgi:hypothetical protein
MPKIDSETTEDTQDKSAYQLGDSTEAAEELADEAIFPHGEPGPATPLNLGALRREATLHPHDRAERPAGASPHALRAVAAQARMYAYGLRDDSFRAWRNSLRGTGTLQQYSELVNQADKAAWAANTLDLMANANPRALHAAEDDALAEGKANAQPRSVEGRSP